MSNNDEFKFINIPRNPNVHDSNPSRESLMTMSVVTMLTDHMMQAKDQNSRYQDQFKKPIFISREHQLNRHGTSEPPTRVPVYPTRAKNLQYNPPVGEPQTQTQKKSALRTNTATSQAKTVRFGSVVDQGR
jgi:hypothetical protein